MSEEAQLALRQLTLDANPLDGLPDFESAWFRHWVNCSIIPKYFLSRALSPKVNNVIPTNPALGLSLEARRRHVRKALSSRTFSRAAQLRALLAWLADRSMREGSPVPSEREVAETVLGRRDFDPQADSLVRKEMARLRDKLMAYYAHESPDDGLRIALPGGYRVEFQETHAPLPSDAVRVLWLPFRAASPESEPAMALWEELLLQLSRKVDVVPPSRSLEVSARLADLPRSDATHVVEGRFQGGAEPTIVVWISRPGSWKLESSSIFTGEPRGLRDVVTQWVVSVLEGDRNAVGHAVPMAAAPAAVITSAP